MQWKILVVVMCKSAVIPAGHVNQHHSAQLGVFLFQLHGDLIGVTPQVLCLSVHLYQLLFSKVMFQAGFSCKKRLTSLLKIFPVQIWQRFGVTICGLFSKTFGFSNPIYFH